MTEPPELDPVKIEQIRRDVAKAYHDLMIDLAMKGEGQVGNRRFWRNGDNEIEWEDLPDDGSGTVVSGDGGLSARTDSEHAGEQVLGTSGDGSAVRLPKRSGRRTEPTLGIVRAPRSESKS